MRQIVFIKGGEVSSADFWSAGVAIQKNEETPREKTLSKEK
jgi:hypothetical protein